MWSHFKGTSAAGASLLTAKGLLICSSAGEKQGLPLPDRADQLEPRETRNTEEKQQEKAESKLEGEHASPAYAGRGRR